MFSATIANRIAALAKRYLNNPERVDCGATNTPAPKIKQENIHTSEKAKYNILTQELSKREGSVIVFVKTKRDADELACRLRSHDHLADAIHGDLQQRRRERVIRDFRQQRYRIMVATDVASRGLDIPHIEHVINFSLPHCPEDYIHRIGRTARAGAEGSALNLISPEDDKKWKAIHRLLNPTAYAAERQQIDQIAQCLNEAVAVAIQEGAIQRATQAKNVLPINNPMHGITKQTLDLPLRLLPLRLPLLSLMLNVKNRALLAIVKAKAKNQLRFSRNAITGVLLIRLDRIEGSMGDLRRGRRRFVGAGLRPIKGSSLRTT